MAIVVSLLGWETNHLTIPQIETDFSKVLVASRRFTGGVTL
jgi:hypothetical protein